ncbi:SAM-dependent methyltransferase [Caloramator sp. Dgby_cultured_2]|uniref:SAM-dependent methyltransferase n=1 Tax=Caloramator sp. Dgby_cultured_2 TaxID=3029174 RepID=UPI00237D88FA|nr:SAM-dependent methyltransferase [Caloramator sp. Dgby_cultured_2]WDU84154.1 SAM-dependent methyltransferase [Caloramator sp. Dgby_cultured_2]
MILSERLRHIVDMLPNSDCIADIGTDHGYILVHCINKGLCKEVLQQILIKVP